MSPSTPATSPSTPHSLKFFSKVVKLHPFPRLIILLLALGLSLEAHPDLNENIANLSSSIREKPCPALYLRRAREYLAQKEYHHAHEDLDRAQSANLEALQLRRDVFLAARAPLRALLPARSALTLSGEMSDAIALASTHLLLRQDPQARAVLAPYRTLSLDGWLLKAAVAENQVTRLSILRNALSQNSSIVLQQAHHDALIATGRGEQIRDRLLHSYHKNRFKAPTALRLAKIAALRREPEIVQQLAQEALTEINQRFNPQRPDLTLLRDRIQACFLLGEIAQARTDLALLKASTISPLLYHDLESQLSVTPNSP